MDRRAEACAIKYAAMMRALQFSVVDAYYLGYMDGSRRLQLGKSEVQK